MLHFATHGQPHHRPVLFIHGGALTGQMWVNAAQTLTDAYAILPDLPGHGQSRHRPLGTFAQAADDLAAVLAQTTEGRPADIVGLSLGSYIGLLLMVRHPHLVNRAFLSGLHAGGMPRARLMKAFLYLISPLMRFGWMHERSGKAMGVKDTSLFLGPDGRPNVTPATLRRLGAQAVDYDARDLLASIYVPTLVLAGGQEHPTILASLETFARTMPACRAGRVPGLGHAWCAQDEALFHDTLQAWLADAPLPPAIDLIDTAVRA